MAPRVVDRQAVRKRLLAVATEVFAERGFQGTRMLDVARAAKVGKATLYEYFADKNDLVFGVFDQLMAHSMEASITPKGDTFADHLHAIADQMWASLEVGEQVLPLMVELWRVTARGPEAERVRSRFRAAFGLSDAWMVAAIEAAKARGEVRPDVDAGFVSAAFTATLDGLVLQRWLIGREGLAEIAAQHIEQLCRGMAPAKGDL